MSTMRDDDPLSRVMAPPPDETAEDREARVLAEQEAKRISDAIDEELQNAAKAERRGPRPTKMLLLGELRSMTLATLMPTACAPLQVKANQVRKPTLTILSIANIYRSPRQVYDAEE